jgi:hypothetical protein
LKSRSTLFLKYFVKLPINYARESKSPLESDKNGRQLIAQS